MALPACLTTADPRSVIYGMTVSDYGDLINCSDAEMEFSISVMRAVCEHVGERAGIVLPSGWERELAAEALMPLAPLFRSQDALDDGLARVWRWISHFGSLAGLRAAGELFERQEEICRERERILSNPGMLKFLVDALPVIPSTPSAEPSQLVFLIGAPAALSLRRDGIAVRAKFGEAWEELHLVLYDGDAGHDFMTPAPRPLVAA